MGERSPTGKDPLGQTHQHHYELMLYRPETSLTHLSGDRGWRQRGCVERGSKSARYPRCNRSVGRIQTVVPRGVHLGTQWRCLERLPRGVL